MDKLYPRDYSNKEIEEDIKRRLNIAQGNQIKPGIVVYELGHAQLGFAEIDKRRNKWISIVAIVISIISLIISVVSLLSNAFYSFHNYSDAKNWQSDQLDLLEDINQNLKPK